MATWSKTAQLTTGTLALGATDRLWFNGATYGDNIGANTYNDSTHVTNSSDVHQCTTNHVNNTKFLTSNTVSVNGAGSSALSALTTAQAPLLLNFADGSAVATSGGVVYAYDGTTDTTAPVGVTVQLAEAGTSSSWVDSQGSGTPLTLANQAAATSHDFFIAISASPTSNGAKNFKIKAQVTYV